MTSQAKKLEEVVQAMKGSAVFVLTREKYHYGRFWSRYPKVTCDLMALGDYRVPNVGRATWRELLKRHRIKLFCHRHYWVRGDIGGEIRIYVFNPKVQANA